MSYRVLRVGDNYAVRKGSKNVIQFSLGSWGDKAQENANTAAKMLEGGATKEEVRKVFPKAKPGTKKGQRIRRTDKTIVRNNRDSERNPGLW